MNKQIKICIIGVLLLICFSINVSAELQLTPSTLNFNGNISTNLTQQINLTNTFSFPIYNLSFTSVNYITFPTIVELQPNEAIFSNIIVNTGNNEINSNYQSTISFTYLTPDIATPQTHLVQVNSATGFLPTSLNIRVQDTIIFNNNGVGNVSLTQITPSYNLLQVIQPNQNYTYPINSENTFTFIDAEHQTPGLSVNVITNQIQVATQNINYNKNIALNINTIGNSSIIYSFTDDNLTIESGKSDETILNLENIGNTIIDDISLSCDWCSFSTNNFDLDIGEDKNIIVDINTEINSTEQTNKTHNLTIKLTSSNTNIDIPFNIFIPYKEIIEPSNIQDKISSLREEILSLVSELDSLGFNTSDIIFMPVPHQVNYTDEEIKKMQVSPEQIQRLQNDFNEMKIQLTNLTEENIRLREETEVSNERTKKESIGKGIFWFIIIIIILAIVGFFGYKFIKYKRSESETFI